LEKCERKVPNLGKKFTTDGEGFGARGKLDHVFHIEITKETKIVTK